MYENYQIAYRREHALILNQILLTILKKKCMEVSLENLYVGLGVRAEVVACATDGTRK